MSDRPLLLRQNHQAATYLPRSMEQTLCPLMCSMEGHGAQRHATFEQHSSAEKSKRTCTSPRTKQVSSTQHERPQRTRAWRLYRSAIKRESDSLLWCLTSDPRKCLATARVSSSSVLGVVTILEVAAKKRRKRVTVYGPSALLHATSSLSGAFQCLFGSNSYHDAKVHWRHKSGPFLNSSSPEHPESPISHGTTSPTRSPDSLQSHKLQRQSWVAPVRSRAAMSRRASVPAAHHGCHSKLKLHKQRNMRCKGKCLDVLEGFWVCGRVCGGRSVYVTSHRPAHTSHAHVFRFVRILHFAFEVISCLLAWPCVSISDYAVTRIYSGYALIRVIAYDSIRFSFLYSHLASSDPQGSEDSINSHIGLS